MQSSLIFLDTRNQFWLDAVHLLSKKHEDERFFVADMGSYAYPKPPPWRVPFLFRKENNPVSAMFSSIGVRYLKIKSPKRLGLKLDAAEERRLRIAAISSAVSATGMPKPSKRALGNTSFFIIQKYMTWKARKAFEAAEQAIEIVKPRRIYIVNGRNAQQKAALLASERKNLDIRFLEIYMGRLTCNRYPPQDSLTAQEELKRVAGQLTQNEVRASATSWLESYSNPHAELNKFRLNEAVGAEFTLSQEQLVIFATSSRDEFESVEFGNCQANWRSQYVAFAEAWKHLKKKNLTPVLRIHPNLINKNPFFVLSELREIKNFVAHNPEFRVVRAGQKISTYHLLPQADLVVVHNSTLGLEASIRGIPVICTNQTSYDQIANVLSFRGERDLRIFDNLPKQCDPKGAMSFVAASQKMSLEIPILPNRISLANYSRLHQTTRAFQDASILSIVFEKRWFLYRRINMLLDVFLLGKLAGLSVKK